MKTIWISILGFSSGRTAWVTTDGGLPYDGPDCNPTSEANGVVSRFFKKGCKELLQEAKKAKKIKLMSWGKEKSKVITYKQLKEALDPWTILEDKLAGLMPKEKR